MAISGDIKLSVFNGALRMLGSRRLAALSENREPRRVLDDIWNNGEVVDEALEQGDWNFALRSRMLDYESDVETGFGFRRAFARPSDFKRLSALSDNEYFRQPLTDQHYSAEGAYFLADLDVLYVRYVSNDGDYGQNSGLWTSAFKTYLEAKMAFEACERITNSTSKQNQIVGIMRDALANAKGVDGMNDGPKMIPHGSWSTARNRGAIGRRDGSGR